VVWNAGEGRRQAGASDSEGGDESACVGRQLLSRPAPGARVPWQRGEAEPRNNETILRVRRTNSAPRVITNKLDGAQRDIVTVVVRAHVRSCRRVLMLAPSGRGVGRVTPHSAQQGSILSCSERQHDRPESGSKPLNLVDLRGKSRAGWTNLVHGKPSRFLVSARSGQDDLAEFRRLAPKIPQRLHPDAHPAANRAIPSSNRSAPTSGRKVDGGIRLNTGTPRNVPMVTPIDATTQTRVASPITAPAESR
jgi:hypothetical protein